MIRYFPEYRCASCEHILSHNQVLHARVCPYCGAVPNSTILDYKMTSVKYKLRIPRGWWARWFGSNDWERVEE